MSFEIDLPYEQFPVYSELIRGKYLGSIGEYRRAAAAFTVFTESAHSEALTETVIYDIEDSFLRSGDKTNGARLLERLGLEQNSHCLFAAARLYRRAGMNRDAGRCMDALLTESPGRIYNERELWYSFDIKVRSSLAEAVGSLDYYIARWEDPDFFIDSLDNLCSALARRRNWDTIRLIAEKLKDSGPAEIYDRCRYISERAAALGYIEGSDLSEREAIEPYATVYYRILSGDKLEELRPSKAMSPEAELDISALNDEEKYIYGLIQWDLDNVLEEIKKYSEQMSEPFLDLLCFRDSRKRRNT